MTDPNKKLDFFNMIEQEINCTICGKYMGHIVVKKDAASDNEIVDALNVLNRPATVDMVCPSCWITKIEKRDFHRIE